MAPPQPKSTIADIAIVGGGPSGLVLAIALARRGIPTTVFERDAHPEIAPRFNPDRSYTIDISGHGLKALRHIDACAQFDELADRRRFQVGDIDARRYVADARRAADPALLRAVSLRDGQIETVTVDQ